MRKAENDKQIIEILEEVKIGEVILEAGDKIEVLNENSSKWEKKIYEIIKEMFDRNFSPAGDVFSGMVANSLASMKRNDEISVDMGAEFLFALGESSLKNRERFDRMFPPV